MEPAMSQELTKSIGLLDKIVPPRIEDAGLEDCKLSPDSIKEAFFKAASAVKSRAASIFDGDEGSCVQDPWPEDGGFEGIVGVPPVPEIKDKVVVGVEKKGGDPAPCMPTKGAGLVDEGGEDVVVVGGGEGEEGGKGCVDGGKEKGNGGVGGGDKEEEAEGKSERPTLIEGYM